MTVTAIGEGVKALPMNLEARDTVSQAAGKHEAVLEPKWDGWRTLWIVDADGKARFYTRTGNELTGRLPAIEAEVAAAFPPGSIIDGEVVAFCADEQGLLIHKRGPVAKCLQSDVPKAVLQSGAMSLVVFDLLQHAEHDARPLQFGQRRKLLEVIFESNDFSGKVTLCPQLEATDDNYDALILAGYEGGVVKWLDAPYASGSRGKGQWKVKASHTDEAIIVGYKPGTPGSSFDGLVGAIEFAQYDANGVLVHRGRCSGMDFTTRVDITKNKEAYLNRVFEFSFLCVEEPAEGAKYGAFRSPNFKLWRDEKDADQVVIQYG